MLDRVQFVNEMKKALNLLDSYKVESDDYICPVTTDEILDPNGFDLTLGKQVFHFNMRNNSRLIEAVQIVPSAGGIPKHIYDECLAILNCEDNNFNGFRTILDNASATSRNCRYYSALSYYYGKDIEKDWPEAFKLLVETPWNGYDEKLQWIKDPAKRRKAAFICYYWDAKNRWIEWNYEGEIHAVLNLEGRQPFIETEAECYQQLGMKGDHSDRDVNNYGVYLWELGKKKEALPFIKSCADQGSRKSCYEVGVLYMFGYYDNNTIKSPHLVPKDKLLLARDYFEKSLDNGRYDDEEYAYLSLLYWLVGDTPNAEKNDKIGSEKGFSISAFRYGMRLYERAKKQRDGNLLKEAINILPYAYCQDHDDVGYFHQSKKKPYWFTEVGTEFNKWLEGRIKTDVVRYYHTEHAFRYNPNTEWWLK